MSTLITCWRVRRWPLSRVYEFCVAGLYSPPFTYLSLVKMQNSAEPAVVRIKVVPTKCAAILKSLRCVCSSSWQHAFLSNFHALFWADMLRNGFCLCLARVCCTPFSKKHWYSSRSENHAIWLQGYVVTIRNRLENNNGSHWSLLVKINDGSATADVEVSDQVPKSLNNWKKIRNFASFIFGWDLWSQSIRSHCSEGRNAVTLLFCFLQSPSQFIWLGFRFCRSWLVSRQQMHRWTRFFLSADFSKNNIWK